MSRALTLGLLLAASLAAACGWGGAERPNVLLVTVDTLRADRLGAWGYTAATSPAIDRLADESVAFLDAQASSSWTLASLASLFTSLHSSTHRVWGYQSHLDASFTTLAERLAAAGFRTAGIGSHSFLAERFGLQQGFAEFDSELVQKSQMASHLAITSPQVTARAVEWLREHGEDGPWLLWAHYFDPHAVYLEHAGVSERFGSEEKTDLYDGEIAFTDAAIGELISELDGLGLGGDTVVVLTADHGEEFGERGGDGHGRHLHREVLHVPLLFRVPGVMPLRVETRVRLLDVLPTLLELVGIEPPEGLEGRSLVPVLRGQEIPPLPVLTEVRLHGFEDSLETGGWKLVRDRRGGSPRLYDVGADRAEQRDLAPERPDLVSRLADALARLVQRAAAKGREYPLEAAPELTEGEIRSLRDLGYIEEEP